LFSVKITHDKQKNNKIKYNYEKTTYDNETTPNIAFSGKHTDFHHSIKKKNIDFY